MKAMQVLRNERGYTLAEALGVMVLGVLATASASQYMGDRNRLTDHGSQKMAAALRLARTRAVLNTRPVGVQFYAAAGTYVIFDDVGRDGLGPADMGYPGPDLDGTESNGRYDGPDGGVAEPTVRESTLHGEGLSFAILADATSMDPENSQAIGSDPVPAANDALVFISTGRLQSPTPGKNFVYLADALGTQMRCARVDLWTGDVAVHRWDFDVPRWRLK